MKTLTTICLLTIFFATGSCTKQGEEIVLQGKHADLTTNPEKSIGWTIRVPKIDSITSQGVPYYLPFPENIGPLYLSFSLKSIDTYHRVYLRYSHYSGALPSDAERTYIDTIRIQRDRGDSIICKFVNEGYNPASPDFPGYQQYTFYGKYNPASGNIEGIIDPMQYTHRCSYCVGTYWFKYTGPVQAELVPF